MLSLHMGAWGPHSGFALVAGPFPAEPPLGEGAESVLYKGLTLAVMWLTLNS